MTTEPNKDVVTTCDDSGRSSQVHNKHKSVLSYDPEPTNMHAHLYVPAVNTNSK